MDFVILDLEWSGAYSRRLHRFVNEIIEFGAVRFNEKFEITDKFQTLVKPQISKRISKEVLSLMDISKDELFECETDFISAVRSFENFAEDCLILTWGMDDILVLLDNYKYHLGNKTLPFITKHCDLQDYCHKNMPCEIETEKLGLFTCVQKLDISQENAELHRAFVDAQMSMKCMEKLYDKVKFEPYIKKVDSNFYRKLTFKNKRITDIHNPLIDETQLDFICDECGEVATQVSGYNIKNRSLYADYFCLNCTNEFKGKITLTLKYDKVVVKKFIVNNSKEQTEEVS